MVRSAATENTFAGSVVLALAKSVVLSSLSQ